jgi:3-oxoacyl-[acyl-carrier-protein] synthase-1
LAHQAPQIWITGLGAVSCLGSSVEDLWSAAAEERSGVRDGLGRVPDEIFGGRPANRALTFSVHAAREAMRHAGWSRLNPDDGLIVATTTGFFLQWVVPFREFVNQRLGLPEFRRDFLNQPLMELNLELSRALGHRGPSTVITSACSASTQALAVGAMWIKQGRVKRCLVAGVEVICDLTSEGFRSLQLLSMEPATPFDKDRRGINLSEGAAFLCLEAGDAGLAKISGYGFSTDAFHMTGPHPEGNGSFRAMSQAVRGAGLRPEDVHWVHAHGTGSQQNDLSEGLAVKRLCGEHRPYVSSTKWLHGHSLAASGALESVLVVRAMQEGVVLKTRGLKNPDPRIPVLHPERDEKVPPGHVLKNTLGFGGANASLVLSHARAVQP